MHARLTHSHTPAAQETLKKTKRPGGPGCNVLYHYQILIRHLYLYSTGAAGVAGAAAGAAGATGAAGTAGAAGAAGAGTATGGATAAAAAAWAADR